MTNPYNPIDLSNLPAPQAITPVSAETEINALLALFRRVYPNFSTFLESDPAYKLIEAFGLRLAVEKQRRNEAIKAVMLAYAAGSDLDQLGANLNVARLTITPADPSTTPPTPAVMERDEDFRRRIQLSLESYSTAGSVGSYVYHALSASAEIGDVQVTSPEPGEVVLSIMGRDGTGEASDALLRAVKDAVNADDVRPLTDHVTVKSAEVIPYALNATLDLYPGPDSAVVVQNAREALADYCGKVHKIGYMVATSGIYAALQQPGVRNVVLHNWDGDLVIADGQVSFCTGIALNSAESAHV